MKLLWEIFITFFKIGAFTFGGGYAMIPLMQHEVCTLKKWVREEDMVDVLVVAQSTPGAIAINSSTFIGYKIAGIKGAFAATLGVILPAFLIILSLAGLLMKYGDSAIMLKVFYGIRAVVVALIVAAVFKMFKSCITDYGTLLIAVISFFLLFYFRLTPVVAIIIGGIAGLIIYKVFLFSQDTKGDN
ncbi:MAG: chromate transporter [Clostridia bacterium]|nr:chromate transporter [Clostridia bacterium]